MCAGILKKWRHYFFSNHQNAYNIHFYDVENVFFCTKNKAARSWLKDISFE